MSVATEMRMQLEELVSRFRVCWDVFPHEEMWYGERLQTGFDVELYGTHDARCARPSPGCPECIRVYDALQAIALSIVPEERRPSVYQLSPFDQSIRYSHLRHDRPDVLLTLTIAHRANMMAPIDICEVRCLKEIKQCLKELGAQHRTWRGLHHGREA